MSHVSHRRKNDVEPYFDDGKGCKRDRAYDIGDPVNEAVALQKTGKPKFD